MTGLLARSPDAEVLPAPPLHNTPAHFHHIFTGRASFPRSSLLCWNSKIEQIAFLRRIS